MILFPILVIVFLISGYFLIRDSDKIHEELKSFEHRASYGPKEDISNLRKELFNYKKCWHKFHYLKMNKVFAIVDARQKWEK